MRPSLRDRRAGRRPRSATLRIARAILLTERDFLTTSRERRGDPNEKRIDREDTPVTTRGELIMSSTPNNIHRAHVSLKLPTKVHALVTCAPGDRERNDRQSGLPQPDSHARRHREGGGRTADRRDRRPHARKGHRHGAKREADGARAAAPAAQGVHPGAGQRERRKRRFDHPERRRRPSARRPPAVRASSAARAGLLSGTASLVTASAAGRASYEWQYSTDAGKTWLLLPPTLQAKTSVSGLQAGTVVQFRNRAVTKTGASDWSPAVSLLIQ